MTDDEDHDPEDFPKALPAPAGARHLPAVSQDGSFAAVAGKYVRGSAAAALSMLGGAQWLADYGKEDPEGFVKNVVRPLLKEPARVMVTEEEEDVESLLRKLDREVIDVEPESGAGDAD